MHCGAAFNANHLNGVRCDGYQFQNVSQAMIWGPWIVTASVAEKVDDPAVMKNTCCFNWLELSVMNSSKILNNHITHASICKSTIWRCAPIIRVTIAALQLCTRPHLHRNERKQQTNESSEEVRQISSQLVFVWPYHCGCGMSKWWTLERRASLHTDSQTQSKHGIVNI